MLVMPHKVESMVLHVHNAVLDKNQKAIRPHVLLVNRHMLDLTELVYSV